MTFAENQRKYLEQSVGVMTPSEQIVLLFRSASANIAKAIKCINEKDIGGAHNGIVKAQNIYAYLSDILDMHFSLSKDLYSLYSYVQDLLVEANLKKDTEILRQALAITRSFCETWEAAEKKNREK